ncbi:pentatricopeptide repeat-containing protein, partial [Tanacetum coccineum]
MLIYGPRPSVVTVNTLMVYLCKNHKVEAAYWVIRNLKRYGVLPDSRTYHILIRGAKSERKFLLVAELQRKLRMSEFVVYENNLAPSVSYPYKGTADTAKIFKSILDKRSRFDDHALWS